MGDATPMTPVTPQQRWHQAGLAVKTSAAFRKKGVTISLGGTDVPVFLLDASAVVVKITPTTTAAAAVIAIRDQVRRARGGRLRARQEAQLSCKRAGGCAQCRGPLRTTSATR
jgi:hypothetical protein